MIVWESIVVAFSMFSALPMPRVEWNGRSMKYSLLAFPLIGVVIGLCCGGWSLLCARLAHSLHLRPAEAFVVRAELRHVGDGAPRRRRQIAMYLGRLPPRIIKPHRSPTW